MTSAPAGGAGEAFGRSRSDRSTASQRRPSFPARAFGPLPGKIVGVLGWLVIVSIAALLVVAVLVPKVSGAHPYTILTGSMRPGLPPGTLVMVRPHEVQSIKVGDVVTYQLSSGEPAVVTHRVVALGRDARGGPLLQTKGDANPVPDPLWVMPVQVKGTVWYDLPLAGRIGFLTSPGQKQGVTLVLVAGLVGYALWMFVGSARQRRRRGP